MASDDAAAKLQEGVVHAPPSFDLEDHPTPSRPIPRAASPIENELRLIRQSAANLSQAVGAAHTAVGQLAAQLAAFEERVMLRFDALAAKLDDLAV